MKTKKKIWILVSVIALLIVSIKFFPYHCNCNAPVGQTSAAGLKIETIKLGSTSISAEVADTDAERSQGLSDRTSLAEGAGMLFVFDTPDTYGFWMKDMNFALDIVWISPENKIVKIDKSLSAGTYPEVFYPPVAVDKVVELPAGFSDAQGIAVGQNFSLGQ